MDDPLNRSNPLPLDPASRLQLLRARHQAKKKEHNMQTVTTSRKTPTRKSIPAPKIKTRKPVKPEERPDTYATRGQSGPRLDARTIDLNQNEAAVYMMLLAADAPMTLADIGAVTFPNLKPVQANSWTRNSLRRLVCGRLVTKVDRGTYRANTIKVPSKKSKK